MQAVGNGLVTSLFQLVVVNHVVDIMTASNCNKARLPECSRCGMCCIAAPCAFSEVDSNNICIYLSVNSDYTTTCNNEHAKIAFIGSGCFFMAHTCKELYDEFYNIDEIKQELLRKRSNNVALL